MPLSDAARKIMDEAVERSVGSYQRREITWSAASSGTVTGVAIWSAAEDGVVIAAGESVTIEGPPMIISVSDGEPLTRPLSAVVVGGRRSGKTYKMRQWQAIWALSEPTASAVDVPWRACGGHYWVCPVCACGETWWTVQLCDGLDQPPMVTQAEMVKAAAMNHLLDEWETHSEWCLDYLEMMETAQVQALIADPGTAP